MTTPRPDTDLALLVDAGSAWAKASVIGRVAGRWRLVTHAAQPTGWGPNELRRALLHQLAAAVDSRLSGRIDDIVAEANRIECHTAVRLGRLALVAVSRELSAASARRAAEAAGWHVVEAVTLDDGRTLAERLWTLQSVEVDAWLVAGGFDAARSPRGIEAAALVASARRPGAGPVVWAGSSALAGDVLDLFEPGAATAVANPRPEARREQTDPLRAHLQRLLYETVTPERETHLASIAMPRAIGALAAASRLRILGVDIGARAATRALAEPDGTVESRVHARGGISGTALLPGAAGRVARLAGDAGDEPAVADLLQTLHARPASLPHTREELAAVQAVARLQLGALVEEQAVGPLDLVIGMGRTIAAAPHPAQALRILLDGLRPLGVTQLAVDPSAVIGPLGTLGDAEMGEGMELLAEDLLAPLGTTVVTRGGEPGRVAMRVAVHRPGWPAGTPVEVRVGQLQVVPLGRGQQAELTIELGDGVSLGAPRRAPRIQAMATGGAVGLVLDARGIPIGLPRRGDDRRAMLASWRDALQREPPSAMERLS
jgi:hypothetical protein